MTENECDIFYSLNNDNCIHKDLIPFHYMDLILGISVFLLNILTTIAGIGGGAILIPIFMLMGNFNIFYAIPLSIITIIGNSLGRLIFIYNKRSYYNPNKYIINYKVLLQIIPFDANTSFIGFILNMVSPNWLVLLFILIVMGALIYKTFSKTYHQYKTKQIDENIYIDGIEYPLEDKEIDVDGGSVYVNTDVYNNVMNSQYVKSKEKYLYTMILFLICAILFTFTMVRNIFEQSSFEYWLIYGCQFVVLGFIGLGISFYNYKYNNWSIKNLLIYTGISSSTGIISTYIGIGGGMLVNPFLLHLGYPLDIISGTLAMFTLVSSISSISQYILTDRILIYYSIYFFSIGLISSMIGIKIFSMIYKKMSHNYLIVLILAILITFSFILTLIVGIIEII
jgi:uncharacterized membrane protein YfcA